MREEANYELRMINYKLRKPLKLLNSFQGKFEKGSEGALQTDQLVAKFYSPGA
jgi:hypothetical protein